VLKSPLSHNQWVYSGVPTSRFMTQESGQDVIGRLGGIDINRDGRVINLVVVGSSRCYDYSIVEHAIDQWIAEEASPDLIITGGASGVDFLAERWADNHNIPFAVFTEEWNSPRRGLQDEGRKEAPNSLTQQLLSAATHIIAFPSPTSKWTTVVIDMAADLNIPCKIVNVD